MDRSEFVAWRDANETIKRHGTGHGVMSPCVDCTGEWQAEMLDIGRCDGPPEGVVPDDPTVRPRPKKNVPKVRTNGRLSEELAIAS